MRILWLTVDRSYRIAQHFDDFRDSVKKIANVVELKKEILNEKGDHMWRVCREVIEKKIQVDNIVLDYLAGDNNFDFIFCDAFFAFLEEPFERVRIPTGIFIEDVHEKVPRLQIDVAMKRNIKNIFHRFNFGFHKLHRDAKYNFKCIWLPHSARLDKMQYSEEKKYEVLHVGVHSEAFYPYREAAVKALTGKPYFTKIPRPPEAGKPGRKWPIYKDYYKVLSQAKICITGGSIFGAPVLKFVEIPASGALLMSNWFPDLGLMGFVPGVNMVPFFKESVTSDVENLLNDESKIKEIAKAGRKLVEMKHSSDIRARQFINFICKLLKKPLEFPDTEPCSFQVNFTRRPL